MKKHENKYWTDILRKEKKAAKMAKNEDPNASLMNMMRDLYNNGDDNMKKTIAESWTKSQQ